MDRAYEGDEIRQLALELGFVPVVLPKNNRIDHGNMIARCTVAATKSNACFADSKAFGASSRTLKNLM